MSVSRITHLPPTPVVEDKSNDPQSRSAEQHRSKSSAPPLPSKVPARRSHPESERKNFAANSARGRKPAGTRKEGSAGNTWNTGLSLACKLVQAFVPAPDDTGKPENSAFRDLEKMIEGLMTRAHPPTAKELVADAINSLRARGSSEQGK